MKAPSVSVLVSDSGDPRLSRLLRSLERQSLLLDEVLVEKKGTVASSRNMMVREARGDILVFIDTDEEAPPDWLQWLTRPLHMGWDIACGPTAPHYNPWYHSRYNDYQAAVDELLYQRCQGDQTAYPMGNTAWKQDVFSSIYDDEIEMLSGRVFDEDFGGWAGEDYDVNVRAQKAGFRGKFVPRAWVWHDQSHLGSAIKILRRKYRYMVGGALAYLKHDGERVKANVLRIRHQPRHLHWLELLNPPLRVLAYLKARRLMA